MTSKTETDAVCIRCSRHVDIDSDEFLYGEATEDGSSWICESCLTAASEQQAITNADADETYAPELGKA